MKVVVVFLAFIFLASLYFANGETVEFRASNTETIAIFAFPRNGLNDLPSTFWYFIQLLSFWDVDKSIIDYSNLPLQIFLGEKYNATSLMIAADSENNTAALIVLFNNDEFNNNMTEESTISNLNSTTKCDESGNYLKNKVLQLLCQITQQFLETPRDPLTKLNLIYITSICLDESFFKEFYDFGEKNGYQRTKTYLISNALTSNNQTCKSNNKYLNHQYIPSYSSTNYSFKADTERLADPRFEFDTKYADSSMFVTINETQYNKAIKSIADYYNNNPLNYLVTLTIQNIAGSKMSKQITTAIPKVDYCSSSSLTIEKYLRQNFDYLLKRNGNKSLTIFDVISKAQTLLFTKNVVIFSDDLYTFNDASKLKIGNAKVKFIQI